MYLTQYNIFIGFSLHINFISHQLLQSWSSINLGTRFVKNMMSWGYVDNHPILQSNNWRLYAWFGNLVIRYFLSFSYTQMSIQKVHSMTYNNCLLASWNVLSVSVYMGVSCLQQRVAAIAARWSGVRDGGGEDTETRRLRLRFTQTLGRGSRKQNAVNS